MTEAEGQAASSQEPKGSRKEGPVELAAILAMVFVLMVKLLFVYMRFKRKAKRAAKNFRKAAVKGGMDKETAARLSQDYECFFSIRALMRQAMDSRKKGARSVT